MYNYNALSNLATNQHNYNINLKYLQIVKKNCLKILSLHLDTHSFTMRKTSTKKISGNRITNEVYPLIIA